MGWFQDWFFSIFNPESVALTVLMVSAVAACGLWT